MTICQNLSNVPFTLYSPSHSSGAPYFWLLGQLSYKCSVKNKEHYNRNVETGVVEDRVVLTHKGIVTTQ